MRDVAIVSFAQHNLAAERGRNDVEILMPVVREAVTASGIDRRDIGFTCSGSNDYLVGGPFSFVTALDAVGAWPPIRESHVEMDAAWALYEAWVQLQKGIVDSALVYGFGKTSLSDLAKLMTLQLDPYYQAPLWPDGSTLAALQARAYLEASGRSERDVAEVAARSRDSAVANDASVVRERCSVDDVLAEEEVASPLHPSEIAPITDGAAAVVLAAGDLARSVSERPAWIRAIEHRTDTHALGSRDLTRAASATTAAEAAGVGTGPVDVAELHAVYAHEELMLRDALGLREDTDVNPSGGALGANPVMATGLARVGEAATAVLEGSADRVIAHATQGPCLQQNLVCVLGGSHG